VPSNNVYLITLREGYCIVIDIEGITNPQQPTEMAVIELQHVKVFFIVIPFLMDSNIE